MEELTKTNSFMKRKLDKDIGIMGPWLALDDHTVLGLMEENMPQSLGQGLHIRSEIPSLISNLKFPPKH